LLTQSLTGFTEVVAILLGGHVPVFGAVLTLPRSAAFPVGPSKLGLREGPAVIESLSLGPSGPFGTVGPLGKAAFSYTLIPTMGAMADVVHGFIKKHLVRLAGVRCPSVLLRTEDVPQRDVVRTTGQRRGQRPLYGLVM
jgi:hypothetical protein